MLFKDAVETRSIAWWKRAVLGSLAYLCEVRVVADLIE